MIKQNAPHW